MAFKRFYHSVLLLVCLGLVASNVAHSSDAICVDVLCDKDEYLIGEDIWVDILVINCGGDTIRVPLASAYTDYLRFITFDINADTVPYYPPFRADYTVHPTILLNPGDTLYNVYNFADGELVSPRSTDLIEFPFEGTVSVIAQYWKSFKSNTLSFRISRPLGSDSAAYDLLSLGSAHPDFLESNRLLTEVLERFPESVYAPRACHELSMNYRFNDSIPSVEKIEGLLYCANLVLESYRRSGHVLCSLISFAEIDMRSERETVVRRLLSETESFRTRMIARNLANSIAFF